MKSGNFRDKAVTGLSFLTLAAVIALLAAAFAGGPKTVLLQAQEGPTAPAPLASSVKIATWNIRDCAASDKSTGERISLHDSVALTIKEAEADIIVLEEIQSDEAKGGDIALLSVALARAGWAMPFVAVVDTRGEDDLAVFSRYKIVEQGPILEPGQADPWPRSGIYASIDVGGISVDVLGFHFKAMGDEKSETTRRAQAKALGLHLIATYGAALTTKAIVLAGDFNTANASDLGAKDSTLSALRLADDGDRTNDFLATNYSFRGSEPTFVDSRYSSVLDHILLSPALADGFDGTRVKVIPPAAGSGAIPTSDHRLVLVEITP
ncbi:MAG: endonuclease/exonuclease/phosphatase family protein [Rectinemataceae bacterium]|nr:endonuclease/exonuclease/phosphatase family protein [Rectinemataceae bacterium]